MGPRKRNLNLSVTYGTATEARALNPTLQRTSWPIVTQPSVLEDKAVEKGHQCQHIVWVPWLRVGTRGLWGMQSALCSKSLIVQGKATGRPCRQCE